MALGQVGPGRHPRTRLGRGVGGDMALGQVGPGRHPRTRLGRGVGGDMALGQVGPGRHPRTRLGRGRFLSTTGIAGLLVPVALLISVALLASGCGDDPPERSPASAPETSPSPSAPTQPSTSPTARTEPAPPRTPTDSTRTSPTPSTDTEPAPPRTDGPVELESSSLRFDDCGQRYLCASLEVPSDHRDPEAGTVTLELGMLPARDRDRRIGVLLVNPGGPGGDMNSFLIYNAGLSRHLLDRFDVVGWNPRGVRGSVPHGCSDEIDRFMLHDPIPDSQEEQAALDEAARTAAEACLEGLGENAGLIGTAQTVADMDSIRQALGEERISYFGFSYGAHLGLLYADRYGTNLRAVVLDGVTDPSLDVIEMGLGQIRGFARVIDDLFDTCRQDPACPVPGDPEAAYQELLARVETTPLRDSDGDVLVGPAEADLAVTMAAYDPVFWPIFYTGLASALQGDGETLNDLAMEYLHGSDSGSFISIGCADSGPMTREDLQDAMIRFEEVAGDFGRAAVQSARPCLYWPETDPLPIGPIRAPDAPPVLVIGNRGDNATPYEWAVAVAGMLENRTLLTYNGQGHLSYGRSPCVDKMVDDYLIDLTLPPGDQECH